jgi:hypothetical protein
MGKKIVLDIESLLGTTTISQLSDADFLLNAACEISQACSKRIPMPPGIATVR